MNKAAGDPNKIQSATIGELDPQNLKGSIHVEIYVKDVT
jgi:hypothetical protein